MEPVAYERKGDSALPEAPRESLVEYNEPTLADDGRANERKFLNKGKKANQLAEILNAILPPREYIAPDSTHLKQTVQTTPSSRQKVVNLQVKLDERLQERQARENGICPVREELYSQCFDELIRQVTIESPERGLLLLRVRDEARMTIAAYQTLYESSITFGMRKALQAEQGNTELQQRIEELEDDLKDLQGQLQDANGLKAAIEKRNLEQKQADEKRMLEEKAFLKDQALHLETYLKSAYQG